MMVLLVLTATAHPRLLSVLLPSMTFPSCTAKSSTHRPSISRSWTIPSRAGYSMRRVLTQPYSMRGTISPSVIVRSGYQSSPSIAWCSASLPPVWIIVAWGIPRALALDADTLTSFWTSCSAALERAPATEDMEATASLKTATFFYLVLLMIVTLYPSILEAEAASSWNLWLKYQQGEEWSTSKCRVWSSKAAI